MSTEKKTEDPQQLSRKKRQAVVDRISRELYARLGRDVAGEAGALLKPNWEVTARIEKEEKYVRFHEWFKKHGGRCPSWRWPVAFGEKGELLGVCARRDIGFNESGVYVPMRMTINAEQFKRSWIGEIYDDIAEDFQERFQFEHYLLIFFVAYQMTLAHRSYWYPYFEVAADSDLPLHWTAEERDLIEDQVLKSTIEEQIEEVEEQHEEAYEIACRYKHLIDPDKLTLDLYKRAYSLVMTRAFGWSVPYMMLVPMADNCNHHCVENYFELFNSRLTRRMLNKEKNFNNHEKQYFTRNKLKVDFLKHFEEDGEQQKENSNSGNSVQQKTAAATFSVADAKLSFKTLQYYKKLAMRDECTSLSADKFVSDENYKDLQIWDLKYLSTSDEEDEDDSEEEEEEDEDEDEEESSEEEEGAKPKKQKKSGTDEKLSELDELAAHRDYLFEKNVDGQGESVPDIARKLKKHRKKAPHITYRYTYKDEDGERNGEEPKKSAVIKKRLDRKAPADLIELLTREKEQLWLREQRMKILKEQDEEELRALVREIDSSDEDEDEEENFAWYDINDRDTYFVLTTLNQHVYRAGDQVFHCYGRRSNRYLLANYGFCLHSNKYDAVTFKINLDFGWKDKVESAKRPAGGEDEEKVSKLIKLKENRLRDEVFAYVRANLINKKDKERKEGEEDRQSHLLVSQPVDPEFEMLVIACVVQLLEGLQAAKFTTTLETDKEMLRRADSGEVPLSHRARAAVVYRVYQKSILRSNITLLQILIRILVRFKSLDPLEMKKSYMQRVEDYETEEEVVRNRLRLRKYLRELVLNQKRLLKAATDAAVKEKQKLLQDQQDQKATTLPIDGEAAAVDKDIATYLDALDHRLGRSTSPFFESSESPTKSVDLAVFQQLKAHQFTQYLSTSEFPRLYSWYRLMSLFSDEVTATWTD